MMKSGLRPGNFIQAKPYAAKAAIRMGITTAGTVTVMLLRNAPVKLSPCSVTTLPSGCRISKVLPANTWP